MENKRKTLTIAFTEYDMDIYNFLKGERNKTALIKHLLRNYMMGIGVQTTPQPFYMQPVQQVQPVQQQVVNTPVVEPEETRIFTRREELVKITKEDEEKIKENRNALSGIDL